MRKCLHTTIESYYRSLEQLFTYAFRVRMTLFIVCSRCKNAITFPSFDKEDIALLNVNLGMTMVSPHYNCTFGKSQFQFQYAVNLRSSKLNR